jgi:hypothetical protein
MCMFVDDSPKELLGAYVLRAHALSPAHPSSFDCDGYDRSSDNKEAGMIWTGRHNHLQWLATIG